MRKLHLAVFLGSLIATHTRARAAEPHSTDVGDSWFALPGLHRVPLMALSELRLSAAFTAGYGLTLADGSHHRAAALPAIGLVATPWLEFGLMTDSRYDVHPGNDTGFISDPKIVAKLGGQVANHVQLGAQLLGWLPGSEKFANTLESTSPELSLFGAYTDRPLTLAAYAGYRLDQSQNAGRNAPRLSQGDRLALSLSQYDAVLAGLGGAYLAGSVVFLGEVSSEILLGNGAPGPTQSPLRASAGVRYLASAQLQLEGTVEASLSNPPGVGPNEPLVTIEPNVSALLGVRYRFVSDPPYVPPAPAPLTRTPKAKPVAKLEAKTSLTVTLHGRDGELLADAKVQLLTPDGTQASELDEQGLYQFKQLKLAPVTLQVSAAGYEPITREMLLTSAPSQLELKLEVSLTGQVRGLVRSFGGTAVRAKIHIQPGGLEITSDAEGFFELDVAPGSYDITIEAKGFVTQKKKVDVEKDGVVVLNADLVKR